MLSRRRLFNNSLSGPLPDAWGGNQSFPRLQIMALQQNRLSGAVPAAGASAGMGTVQGGLVSLSCACFVAGQAWYNPIC